MQILQVLRRAQGGPKVVLKKLPITLTFKIYNKNKTFHQIHHQGVIISSHLISAYLDICILEDLDISKGMVRGRCEGGLERVRESEWVGGEVGRYPRMSILQAMNIEKV